MTKNGKAKARLESRLQELVTKVNEIDRTLREPDSPDSEERATENEGEEVLEDIGNAALNEICSINAALDRMDAGNYGKCTLCQEKIDSKRLETLPNTAMCSNCAIGSEIESTHKRREFL